MSQTWSTISNHGSRSGSEEPEVRPFVRRTDDEILANLHGRALNARNLAINNTPVANHCRKTQAPEKIRKVDAAARELKFKLPSKTEQQLLESFSDAGAMNRFLNHDEGGVGGQVDEHSWNTLVMNDNLAADLDAEMERM